MSQRARWCCGGFAFALIAASCAFDWDSFDPRATGAGGIGGGGQGGEPSSGGGGQGGAGTGGIGGVSGPGGAGGAGGGGAPALVDRGLLLRYFLDEADSGTAPTEALDRAPQPLNLPLDYGFATAGGGGVGGGGGTGGAPATMPNMTFATLNGHRGLTWSTSVGPGVATTPVAATKLNQLNNATEGTIECVADVRKAVGAIVCGRIFHLGQVDHGNFTLCTGNAQHLSFRLTASPVEEWTIDLSTRGRVVLHAVYDSNLQNADDRMRLYVDGLDRGVGDIKSEPPLLAQPIVLTTGDVALGNRPTADGSTEGDLFYCALYTVALTADEIASNAALLTASDDTP